MSKAIQPQDADADAARGSRTSLFIVCLCFVLSGVAALAYQTVWARKFALVFGTSELAIAAVLAAYMGGLALGAWIIEKLMTRVSRPLTWYASIEVGIAVAALALVPAGQWLVEQVLVSVFGGQPSPPDAILSATTFYYLAAAFLVLLLPTTLMGATLPLLARYAVHNDGQIGSRVGLLYACNTAGAVGGALLGALVLLPSVGLMRTVWAAAAINLAVAVIAYGLGRTAMNQPPNVPTSGDAARAETSERMRVGASAAWVLPLMLVSGAVSFLHEVLWTRMLGHVLGSSIYAFGVMLASFLAGIALGGGLGAVLARYRESAARWLAVSELAAGIAAVGAWYILQHIGLDMDSMAERIVFGFALLFTLAFAIGLTYPLAVRVLARNVGDAAVASARVYSWNTVGAIVGAVGGGFLVVPALRYEGAVRLAVIASCFLAIFACFALFRPTKRFGIAITAASIAVAGLFVPGPPESLLRYSPLQEPGAGELLYYDVGQSAAVVTLRLGDLIDVRTNGLPEAAIDIRGTSPRMYAEAWMAPLAVLARPALADMLVVGFGGGRVLEAVPRSVQQIEVIELEEKVIDANRLLGERGLRDPAHDPLHDDRVNLIINDARGTLQLTTKTYDAIVSQPSHPWTAGASHLYTLEFMRQAREHLEPGGVFVQWMNVRFLDEELLRSLLATLTAVYPHVRVYRPEPPTLLFLASEEPIGPERNYEATRAAIESSSNLYGRLGLNAVEDLVASLALDSQGVAALADGANIITDDTNRFAVASVHDFGRNIGASELGSLLAPHDPLLDADGFVLDDLGEQLAFDYIARRIHSFATVDASARTRLEQFANRFSGTDMAVYIRSLSLLDDLDSGEAWSLMSDNARQYPDSDLLEDAMLVSRLAAFGYDAAPATGAGVAGRSGGGDHVVMRAVRLAAAGDWGGVADLEAELAAIPWASIWNPPALRLRAERRARLLRLGPGTGIDADSIEMIDRLGLVEPSPQLFLLRALSAGNDAPVLTESLFRYALAILQGLILPDEVPRRDFDELLSRFSQLEPARRVYPYHDVEVKNLLDAVAELLE